MLLKGRLLYFDKLINNDHYFTRDSKIYYGFRIPLIVDFTFDNLNQMIGYASIYYDDFGLLCYLDIFDDKTDFIKENLTEIGIGGNYIIKDYCFNENNIKIIKDFSISSICLTKEPADKDCKIIEEIKQTV